MVRGRQAWLFTAVFVLFFAMLFIYAIQSNPPVPEKYPPEYKEGEQASVLQAELGQVEPARAERVHIEVPGLHDAASAEKIAINLQKLGSVGQVTVDLKEQSFTVEFDREKLDQNKLKQAFAAAGFPVQAIHKR
jgi:copper chaperone CopZ